MLFAKRPPRLRRILVVEDEPLVAFDNEHALGDAGYEVVATVDCAAAAIRAIAEDTPDLVVTDLAIAGDGDGLDVARAAQSAGVPVLFVTGHCPLEARALAVGCLAKPYGPRDLPAALRAIEEALDGGVPRRVPGALSLYIGGTAA